jgi:hypothetical protein
LRMSLKRGRRNGANEEMIKQVSLSPSNLAGASKSPLLSSFSNMTEESKSSTSSLATEVEAWMVEKGTVEQQANYRKWLEDYAFAVFKDKNVGYELLHRDIVVANQKSEPRFVCNSCKIYTWFARGCECYDEDATLCRICSDLRKTCGLPDHDKNLYSTV